MCGVYEWAIQQETAGIKKVLKEKKGLFPNCDRQICYKVNKLKYVNKHVLNLKSPVITEASDNSVVYVFKDFVVACAFEAKVRIHLLYKVLISLC